jgi:hypothetical protein
MRKFGIQLRGTGKAVAKMSLGGALATKSNIYQGKPGTYEQSYYTQALFPQATQTGYTPPPSTENKKEDKKEEGMARGGAVKPVNPKKKKKIGQKKKI